jgi:hypothetical protein
VSPPNTTRSSSSRWKTTCAFVLFASDVLNEAPAHLQQANQNRELSRESDWLSFAFQHFRIKMLQKFPTGDIMTTTRSTMVFFHYSASGSAECDLWRTVDSGDLLCPPRSSAPEASLVTHSMRKDLVICSLLMFSLKLSPSATAATDPAVIRDFDRSFSSSQEEEGKQPAGCVEVACLFFSWRSVWETR